MSYTKGTWHTGEQIRDHKLACSIINLHGTEDSVFDTTCLDELEEFVLDRSVQNRDKWLIARDHVDEENTRFGDKAASKGSLTGFIIARYETNDPALDERDWELLEEWFQKGRPTGEHVQR